jgi:hypothetical protein
MASLDEEKAATSDEEKVTVSSIQQDAEARKDVSVPNHVFHLALNMICRKEEVHRSTRGQSGVRRATGRCLCIEADPVKRSRTSSERYIPKPTLKEVLLGGMARMIQRIQGKRPERC